MAILSQMCKWCAQSFTARHSAQFLCRTECRKAFDRYQKREWRKANPEEVKRRNHNTYLKHKAAYNQNNLKNYYANHEHYLTLRRENYRQNIEREITTRHVDYQRNREKYLEQKKLYHIIHREQRRAYSIKWNHERREAIKVYKQAYRLKHKDRIRARIHEWERSHPINLRAYGQRRRALKKRSPTNNLTPNELKALVRASKQRCAYCRKLIKKTTIDHITPFARGGAHTLQNLIVACKSCNSRKHTGQPLLPVQPWLLIV